MAPADGYGLNGVILGTPQTVTLAGRKSVLNAVEEIKVPAEALDVTNATADTALMVNVANYLPEGTAFADKTFNGYISVVVGVEKEITEEFEMTDPKLRERWGKLWKIQLDHSKPQKSGNHTITIDMAK